MILPHISFLSNNNKTDNDAVCDEFSKSAIQTIENRLQVNIKLSKKITSFSKWKKTKKTSSKQEAI